jgi:CheY-like chemotaxis protein
MTTPGDPAAPTVHAGTVLYIDDSPINLRLVSRIFERQGEGVTVVEATRGRQGIELALERPDLILLDLNLPDMHGEEVLARLRAEPRTREIPVVVLSADASPGQAERLTALGARAYVTKPIAIPAFLAMVRSVLHEAAVRSAGTGRASDAPTEPDPDA